MMTITREAEVAKTGLGKHSNAMRMRKVIKSIAKEVVNNERPRYQYAQVVTVTPVAKRATVLFPGESTPVTVKMGALQPVTAGQIVRVAGLVGDRYIDDVMSGDVQFNSSATGSEFSPDGFGAPESNTEDAREAIQAAIDAAFAAGGGIVMIRRSYGWRGDIIVKSGVWLVGTRNNDSDADLIALDNTSRLRVGYWDNPDWDRPGGMERIRIDGNSAGHPDGLVWYECVTAAFKSITVLNAAGPGHYLNASQNCHFDSCDVFTSLVGFKLDNGCGGNLFSRCEISTNQIEVLITDTAGMPNAYPFGPAHNVFDTCILENYLDCDTIILAEAGANNHFYTCGLSNNGQTLSSGKQVKVTNTIYPSISTYLHLDSCNFNGGGAPDNNRATTIHIVGNNFVHLSGTSYLQESTNAFVQDSGVGVLTLDGTFYYGNNVPEATRHTAINSGSTISWIVHREQGFQFDLPANMANVIFTRRIDDAGGRGFITRDFSFGWQNGLNFTTQATLSYDSANSRLLLTGGLRVQNQFVVGNSLDREPASWIFAPAGGGAVTLDASSKSVHGVVLTGTGAITSMTLSNPVNGRQLRLYISNDDDITTDRTVVWPTNVWWKDGIAPAPLRPGRIYQYDFHYDSVVTAWFGVVTAVDLIVPGTALPSGVWNDNTWIEVNGSGGAPSLVNSWANFGSGYSTAAFKREGKLVTLKGLIAGGAANTTIFTLPAGYRPTAHRLFMAPISGVTSGPASAGTAHTHQMGFRSSQIDINATTGVVKLVNDTLGAFAYLGLDDIKFHTDG